MTPPPTDPGRTPSDGRAPAAALRSALPSTGARALAFASIIVAGLCGGLIGSSIAELQCVGDCSTAQGVGALIGAVVAAGGVAVVAVLVLRAMAEWRTVERRRGGDDGPLGPIGRR